MTDRVPGRRGFTKRTAPRRRRGLGWAVLVLAAGVACAPPNGDRPSWEPAELGEDAILFAPGVVSTQEAQEYDIVFPDSATAWFVRRRTRERQRIWEVRRLPGGGWSEARLVPFAGSSSETPWLTPQGDRLYFSSRRPGALEEDEATDNVWIVDRETDGSWGRPRPLPGLLHRSRPEDFGWPVGSELSPEVGPDGALYYWSEEPVRDASSDLYRAPPLGPDGFGPGELLPGPLNSDGVESNLTFTPDGLLIFQGFGRNDGYGNDDLFYSQWLGDRWTEPTALPGTVNSQANEGHPNVSPDGRYLFFASDRTGSWDIWVVELDGLGLEVR